VKLEITPANIERHGVVKKIKCGMEPTAQSFRMLARQYSDPIKAILQELGANAADSHVRAGKKDIPFTVQLPTTLDPHLRIRDYGISMSPETMENVYANYMKSDKLHTNEETGYFGIGSKTPLAYSDSFNITTYFSGVMRMYTVCYDEVGIPELNVYSEYPTDEENGVEVSFAVKKDDHTRFMEQAQRVYAFFSTSPTVNGCENFALKTYEKVLKGKDWYFAATKDYGYESYVIMGNIAYPIKSSMFGWDSPARHLLQAGIHFEVPMGAISMVPSRESLEYNELTIASIEKRCIEIKKEASLQVIEELNQCRSQWEASILANKWKTKLQGMDWDLSACKFDIMKYFDIASSDLEWRFKYYSDSDYAGSHRSGRVKRSANHAAHRIEAKVRMIIQDIDSGFDKRCRSLAGAYLVVYLVKNITKEKCMELMGAIEEDGVVFYASELPEPPKPVRGPYVRKTTRTVKRFCPQGNSPTRSNVYDSRLWDSEHEIDPKIDEHVYVCLDRYQSMDKRGIQISVDRILYAAKKLGLVVPNIIGLNSANAKLGNRKNFICLTDWVAAKLKDLDDQSLKDRATALRILGKLELANRMTKIVNMSSIKLNDKMAPAAKLVAYARSLSQGAKEDEFIINFINLAEKTGYNFKFNDDHSDFKALEESVRDRYPLVVDYIDDHSCRYGYSINNTVSDTIVNTINALDLANSFGE